MTPFDIHQFICLSDNYGVLLHDRSKGITISIDAPDAQAIKTELERKGWTLTHILTTHHHPDHVDGNLPLKEAYGCEIIGPEKDAARIPGMTRGVKAGERFDIAGHVFTVYDCPGHTSGHIAFHMPDEDVLFAADTVFAMGCGRVFEGTMAEMYHSVNQFRSLKPETRVYCGHEYTESNAKFALAMEPGNVALQARALKVKEQRARGEMTCPTTIGEELATNPYFRSGSAEIRKTVGLEQASDAEVFAEVRLRKNSFS